MTRRWADVAELIATQGLKGRFVARPVRGLPFLLEDGMKVDFVPPTLDGPRTACVKRVQHAGDGEYLVDFDAVASRDIAEMLVGSHCLVSRALLPEDFEDLLPLDVDLTDGYRVFDEVFGLLGPIAEVREMPTQDLLVVDRDGEQILIPAVDEFIRSIDEVSKVVHVGIPQGLLALNSSDSEG